ncbi:MAG: thioredoxin family protein [Saprospiraceae bacterium]
MKSIYKLILILIVFSLGSSSMKAEPVDSPFSDISLTTAKEMASIEGKLIFVDFYANWCVPCKWMDETTYADKSVISSLQDKFVSVKINIDDFDGYTLKEEYGIKILPTVLVLDQNGKVIERYEESMSPSKLTDVLNNVSANTTPKTHSYNKSPKEINQNDNLNTENQATVKTTISYRVQVGVYSDYANAEIMLDKIYENFTEPVVVMNTYLNDKTVYKVMVGDYSDKEGADELKYQIDKKLNINSMVKIFE